MISNNSIQSIQRCYDSHTHFLATGQNALGLDLSTLNQFSQLSEVQMKPIYFRQDWLTGFGWDHNKLNCWPTAAQLDVVFPETPVFFSRHDGHVSCVNSKAIQILTKKGFFQTHQFSTAEVPLTNTGSPSGLLFERAHFLALGQLPKYTAQQQQQFCLESQKTFHAAGFTHVRDLSMTPDLWSVLTDLSNQKNIKLAIEAFTTVQSYADLYSQLEFMNQARHSSIKNLRFLGVKIFLDGSLGSRTALLSEPYLNQSSRGFQRFNHEELEMLIRLAWENNQEIAVHTIGDEAADIVINVARQISAGGLLGRLHLEHVEILRNETIQKMKPLHVVCHMQPSHWLNDKLWLSETVSENLLKSLFPWEALRKNKIPFYFGSDTPIEKASLFRTQSALADSAKHKVPHLSDDWVLYHSHPDQNWLQAETTIQDQTIVKVTFENEIVYKN